MSRDPVYEDVPLYSGRAGDVSLASRNNSSVILGRDRVDSVDSGYGNGPDAASIHVVAGRRGPDPIVKEDAATVYVAQKTDPDLQAGTEGIGQNRRAAPAVILRADCVRIAPRVDMKISVGRAYMTFASDGRIIIDGDIQLGEGAIDRVIKGDTFAAVWAAHVHPTPVGTSGPPQPLPPTVFSSRTVKVK